MKNFYAVTLLSLIFVLSGCLSIESDVSPETGLQDEEVVSGLESPWSIEFISENEALVTEKQGHLKLVNIESGDIQNIEGVPEVDSTGQGGLLDVEHHEGEVFITYSDSGEEGTATHLGKANLNLEEGALEDFEVLHVAEPFIDSTVHYGSRAIIYEDHVYFTTGDRGQKDFSPEHVSQNTSNELGATLRLNLDGSIPEDNRFTNDETVVDSIYSYGHRNSQGMTVQNGEIWQSEHGEEDGDEINIIQEGGNYGWPITHTGCEYGTEEPVGESPFNNTEIVNPVYHWECSTGGFPPAGMTFYSDERIESLQGDLFIGNLAGRYLGRFNVENSEVQELEPLLEHRNERIRDVEESPNGLLYAITDSSDASIIEISQVN